MSQTRETTLIERPWFIGGGLVAVMLLGFAIRFDSLSIWLDNKDRYFFADGEIPLLLGVDGYYYLDIAQQVRDGRYQAHDPRRQVPRGYDRPETPAFLSVLLAGLAALTTARLEWVAILLPPFLGILLALPTFLLARALALRARFPGISDERRGGAAVVMSLVAALFALLSPFFVARSGIGWYETDNLNLTFAVLAAYLALRYADEPDGRRRHAWFAAWAVNLLLFLWWWDQTNVPVLGLAGLPMLVAVISVGRRARADLISLLAAFGLLALVLGFWQGFEVLDPRAYVDELAGLFRYVTDTNADAVFPQTGQGVSEQDHIGWARFVTDSAGGWLPFGIAFLGLLALVVAVRHYALYLAALGVVAALSLSGPRFIIFTAPLFGLGVGFLAFLLWHLRWAPQWRLALLALLVPAAAWLPYAKAQAYDQLVPRRQPVLLDAMLDIEKSTPPDAVIWGSWGHGHLLVHYADRSTMGDGIYHPGGLQYALAVPLASSDYRMAANWIAFITEHGVPGMTAATDLFGEGEGDWAGAMRRLQQLLAAGPEQARRLLQEDGSLGSEQIDQRLAFLFPGQSRPIYLMIDYLQLRQSWHSIGRWDFERRAPPERDTYILVSGLTPRGEAWLQGRSAAGPAAIGLQQGIIRLGERVFRLGEITLLDGAELKRAEFDAPDAHVVSIIAPGRMGVYADSDLAETVMHKLYFELAYDDKYFRPLLLKPPAFGIWQVTGERYRSHDHPTD
jgi:hypothetical protein